MTTKRKQQYDQHAKFNQRAKASASHAIDAFHKRPRGIRDTRLDRLFGKNYFNKS